MSEDYIADTRAGYDRVAEEYAERFFGELEHKPLDRALLQHLADLVRGKGPIADVGCGPGQVARYLHGLDVEVLGIDLSPGMLAAASTLTPEVPFAQGSMLDLPFENGSLAGIVAFYAVIHLRPADIPRAFAEFCRVLRPDGRLFIAFHVGDGCVHRDEWWERPVNLDFHFLRRETLTPHLEDAGFVVDAYIERRPYEPVEFPSTRGYLLGRKLEAGLKR